MTVDAAFRSLIADLNGLLERVTDARVTIQEDRPLADDVVLADRLADAAQDVAGWLQECVRAAAAGRKDARRPAGAGAAATTAVGRALAACQMGFERASLRFWSDLGSRAQMEALSAVGRERGGEWWGWTDGVKQAVDRCQPLLQAVMADLFACSREIGDRVSSAPVSVTAMAIGNIGGETPHGIQDRDGGSETSGRDKQRATVGGESSWQTT